MSSLQGLTSEQGSELAEHLSTVLDSGDVLSAVAALDLAQWSSSIAIASQSQLKEINSKRQKYFRNLHARAVALRDCASQLCRGERDVLDDHKEVLVGSAEWNWAAFDHVLQNLIDSARLESGGEHTRRGRPSHGWRDSLIAVVRSVYPAGISIGPGSHFEQTVEMLLDFLGADIQNIQRSIKDALARMPDPPFTVVALPAFKIQ